MNTSGRHLHIHLKVIYLRFKYPLYFRLPAMQIYALHTVLKFFKILKPLKINFFLVGGCLLGAVRQESFAGRPTDIDLGIKEEHLPKLLNAIPLLIKNGTTFIRSHQPLEKTERVQIFFSHMFLQNILLCWLLTLIVYIVNFKFIRLPYPSLPTKFPQ